MRESPNFPFNLVLWYDFNHKPSVYEYKDTVLTLLKQIYFKIPLVVPKKATVT